MPGISPETGGQVAALLADPGLDDAARAEALRALQRARPADALPGLWAGLLGARSGLGGLAARAQCDATRAEGGYADHRTPDLPAATALVHLPWHLDLALALPDALRAEGLYGVIAFDGDLETGDLPPLHLNADTFRTLDVGGVVLWEVAAYTIANDLLTVPWAVDFAAHQAMIADHFARAAALVRRARAYLDFYRPSVVLCTQGYLPLSAILRRLARQRGLRVVAIENTFVRDHIVWDDQEGIAVNGALPAVWYRAHGPAIPPAAADAFAATHFRDLHTRKQGEHQSPAGETAASGVVAPPYLLYLGQVYPDASVAYGIHGFFDQVEVMERVAAWAAARGLRTVIKLHPKEVAGTTPTCRPYDRATFRLMGTRPALAGLMAGGQVVVDADNRLNTYALIRGALGCVTVNSQAGLEAAALGKPVLLAGRAYFSGCGFTWEAATPAELEALLPHLVSGPPPAEATTAARRFLMVFLSRFVQPATVDSLVRLLTGRVERPSPPPA